MLSTSDDGEKGLLSVPTTFPAEGRHVTDLHDSGVSTQPVADAQTQKALSAALMPQPAREGRTVTGVGDDYWLRYCHGFRVESPQGRRGIVEDVLYGAEHDLPSALAVRGGLFGQRLELVPIEAVNSVDPRRKLVTLDDSRGDPDSSWSQIGL
jgi:hypothetical protein